jgi:tRNA nucleotidyltransferase (CCA-adding enzyme)
MAKTQLKPTTHKAMERVREYLTTWQHISIAMTGHDLETMGLQKGPAYQRVLSQIFNAKLDGLATTKKDELRLAKTLIQQETASKSPSFVSKGRALRDAASKS